MNNDAQTLRTISTAFAEFEHDGELTITADLLPMLCEQLDAIADRMDSDQRPYITLSRFLKKEPN